MLLLHTREHERLHGSGHLVVGGVLVSVDLDVRTFESIVGAHMRRSWSRTVRVIDGTSLFDEVGQTVTLELPDGVEGRVVIGSVGGSPAGKSSRSGEAASRRTSGLRSRVRSSAAFHHRRADAAVCTQ